MEFALDLVPRSAQRERRAGPRGVARAVPPGGMFAHKCVGHGWPGLALENLAWHPDSLQHRGGPLREVGAAQARRRCAQSLRPVGPQRGL